MIRFRIFGNPTAAGGAAAALLTKKLPYSDLVLQTDITVGVAVTALGIPGGVRNKWVYLRNISQAGQLIRIGTIGVTFAATPQGMLLYPGESVEIPDFDNTNSVATLSHAIANAAGGILNVFVLEQLI